MEKLLHHIIVIWDEADHVSSKKSAPLAKLFWEGYVSSFPEGTGAAELPVVLATRSPVLGLSDVQTFLHEGSFVPHSGKYKDLALVKYCSTGLVDQAERFHHVVDHLRIMRDRKGDAPMHSDESVMVCLVTSDRAAGMTQALQFVMSKAASHRAQFSCIQTDKAFGQGDARMSRAGFALGKELRARFTRLEAGGLLLNV